MEQGERARSPSPHVRLRVAEICTSHRREPQVEVDLLSTFDGLPLQRRDRVRLVQVLIFATLAAALLDFYCEFENDPGGYGYLRLELRA